MGWAHWPGGATPGTDTGDGGSLLKRKVVAVGQTALASACDATGRAEPIRRHKTWSALTIRGLSAWPAAGGEGDHGGGGGWGGDP